PRWTARLRPPVDAWEPMYHGGAIREGRGASTLPFTGGRGRGRRALERAKPSPEATSAEVREPSATSGGGASVLRGRFFRTRQRLTHRPEQLLAGAFGIARPRQRPDAVQLPTEAFEHHLPSPLPIPRGECPRPRRTIELDPQRVHAGLMRMPDGELHPTRGASDARPEPE